MEFTPVSDDITTSVIQQMYVDSNGLIQVGIAVIGDKEVIIIFGTGLTTSLVYDPKTNNFTPLSMATAITSAFGAVFTKASTNTAFAFATGNTWQDSGSAYTMTAQTQLYYLNKGEPFIVKRVRLLADNQASGTTNLDMTADDYTNWVDIGDFDMTATQKEVWGGLYCSSSCAFRLEHSANTAWRAQAIIVDWEPSRV